MRSNADTRIRLGALRRRRSPALPGILALAGLLLLASVGLTAGSAQAATIVSRAGATLDVTAAGGKFNRVDVRSSVGEIFVSDSGDKVAPGAGCTVYDVNTVSCDPDGLSLVSVSVGDLDDRVTNATGLASTLRGDLGSDALSGGAGADTLEGGSGGDDLSGGAGRDRVDYSARAAAVTVTLDDYLANDGQAGEGDNVDFDVEDVTGGSGNDTLSGSHAPNRLDGGLGHDTLRGLSGSDDLRGGPGNDVHYGDRGSDVFVAHPSFDGADVFYGGTDANAALFPNDREDDHVSYAARTTPVAVDPDGAADDGAAGEGDQVDTDVEDITGGSGNDILTGSAVANALVGGTGADALSGLAGDDLLWGGQGNDTLSGLGGDDLLVGQEGNDTQHGGDGQDTFQSEDAVDGADVLNGGPGSGDRASYAGRAAALVIDIDGVADDGAAGEGDNVKTDVEHVTGGRGNDTLTGSAAADHLDGYWGDDTLHGLAGDDVLAGGDDNDILNGGDGQDTFVITDPLITSGGVVDDSSDGSDTFNGGPGGGDGVSYAERELRVTVDLDGVADDGRLGERDNVKADVEYVTGGSGNDLLIGNAFSNHLYGGPGDDSLDGLGGNDYLFGQDGIDQLDGGAGNDGLNGGNGNDELYGADGISANDSLNGYNGVDSCAADRNDSQTSCEDSSASGL